MGVGLLRLPFLFFFYSKSVDVAFAILLLGVSLAIGCVMKR